MLRESFVARDDSSFAFNPSDNTEFAADSILGDFITIPDADLFFNAEFKRSGNDLKLVGEDGKTFVVHDYFSHDNRPALATPQGAVLAGATVELLAGPLNPGKYAQAAAPQSDAQPIGRVAKADGNATVLRNGVTVALNVGDTILKNDVVQTGSNSALGITFTDGTTFNMTADARMVVNEFIYQTDGANNAALFTIIKGSFAFVASQVAKTGDMKVATPVATMGIRGTEVIGNQVIDASNPTQVTYNVKVYNGSVAFFSLSGAPIGVAELGQQNVWTFTPAGLSVNPTPAPEIQQDQSILNNLFATKALGDQLINQLIQSNPDLLKGDPNKATTPDDHTNAQPQGTQNTNSAAADTPDTPTLTVTLVIPPSPTNSNTVIPTDNAGKIPTTNTDLPATGQLPTNSAPVAAPDTYTINEDTTLGVFPAGVLANDTDADGNSLSAILVQNVQHGTLTLNADGSLVYTPVKDYNGPDSFTYMANDGSENSGPVTVNLIVTPVNDAPVAADDSASGVEDNPIVTGNVLLNDGDIDNTLTAASITGNTNGAHGLVVYNGNGTFTYTPNLNFNGSDSFTYTISDGALSDTATVNISVSAVNDAPVLHLTDATMARVSAGAALHSIGPRLSTDGKFMAFVGMAELPQGNTESQGDTFLYNAVIGTVKSLTDGLVTPHIGIGGVPESFASLPSISASGQYVLFTGHWQTEETSGGMPFTQWHSELLLYDQVANTTTVVATGASGEDAYLSPDGNVVAFEPSPTIGGPGHPVDSIKVLNSTGAVTNLAAHNPGASSYSGPTPLSESMGEPALNQTGQFVTFWSGAPQLVVNGDTAHPQTLSGFSPVDNFAQLYVYNKASNSVTLVSHAVGSTAGGNGHSGTLDFAPGSGGDTSWPAAITPDYIVFQSTASNLVAGDTNGHADIFLYHRTGPMAGQITLLSHNLLGNSGNGDSMRPEISRDGQYVAFVSSASDLVANDTDGQPSAFLYKIATGELTLVSDPLDGTDANGDSQWGVSLSNGGAVVAFGSTANNFTADPNGKAFADIYLLDHHAPLTNEDTPIVLSGASLTDVDAGTGQLMVTLSVEHGTLKPNVAVPGITLIGNPDFLNGVASFSYTGTLDAINAAFTAGGIYTPDANYNGTAHLTMTVNDQGNSGAGGPLSHTKIVPIIINSVNDAPAGADKIVTTDEDVPYVFTSADFVLSDASDSPPNALAGVKIATLPGQGSLKDNGIAVTAGQFVSVADINAGLLKFTPAANANGLGYTHFTFQVQDNGGTANGGVNLDQSPNTITFNVTPVNDAPVANNDTLGAPGAGFAFNAANGQYYKINTSTLSWTAAQAAAAAAGGYLATITSAEENAFINNLKVGTVGNEAWTWLGGSDSVVESTWKWMANSPESGQIFWQDGPGGFAPIGMYANWQPGSEPNQSGDEDYVHMWPGGFWNDLAGTSALTSVIEVDGFKEDKATTFSTNLLLANDTDIEANALVVSAVQGAATGVPVATAHGTVVLNATGTITYTPELNYNGADSFTYKISDGNGGSAIATASFNMAAVNDAPAFSGLDNTPAFTEGGVAVVLDNNASISDPELGAANNYNGATLTLARHDGANAQDVFGASGTLSLSGGNVVVGGATVGTFTNTGGTLAMTFNSNATAASVDSVLDQITYSNTSNVPPPSVQIDFTINDGNAGAQGAGGALTGAGSIMVDITPVDEPAAVGKIIVWDSSVDQDAANSAQTIGNSQDIEVVNVTNNTSSFNTLLSSASNDLVIFSQPSDFGGVQQIIDNLPNIGKLIFSFWDLDQFGGLQSALNVSVAADFFSPKSVIFSGAFGLNGTFSAQPDVHWNDNGDLLTPLNGSQVVAQFAGGGNASIQSADADIIVNGFLYDDLNSASSIVRAQISSLVDLEHPGIL